MHNPRHNNDLGAAQNAAQPQTEWSAIQVGDELVEFDGVTYWVR